MLLLFLLIILVAAIVANIQLHKWKRRQRLATKAVAAPSKRKEAVPQRWSRRELDELDWDKLVQDDPEPTPPAWPSPAVPQQELEPLPDEHREPWTSHASKGFQRLREIGERVQTHAVHAIIAVQAQRERRELRDTQVIDDDFLPLERALMQQQLVGTRRREAMALLRRSPLYVPVQGPHSQHAVLEMEGGDFIPVATHPSAAAIALGHLAEDMQPCTIEQLLAGRDCPRQGLLVVARNPQKPAVARLWKIQPEDL
jgi:hypothetical protein